MLNESTSRSKYVVQSGVTQYPIGFAFQHNGDGTPQIRVTIGDMVAEENVHFVISEDLLNIELLSLGENDKWVGSALVIERDIPFFQESGYQVGRISPEQIEKDFDLSVMRDQMLADEISERADDVQGKIDALNSRIDIVQEEHASDMATVNAEVATKATKAELESVKTALSTVNAEVATKATKAELEIVKNTLNSHTNELTTLSENQAALGNRVAGVEEKIPGDASATNQLATKADLKALDGYVKKSGDTMAGDLTFDVMNGRAEIVFQDSYADTSGNTNSVKKFISSTHAMEELIFARIKNGVTDMQFSMSVTGFFMPHGNRLLGSASYPWANVYAKKLNNGADIEIPTEGGTLARVEDLSGYLPLTGKSFLSAWLGFDFVGEPGGNHAIIAAQTLNGVKGVAAIELDSEGHPTDILYVPKLKSPTANISVLLGTRIGSATAPIRQIHALKIGTGLSSHMLDIPDGPGTLARVEDLTDFAKKGDLSGYLPLSGGTLTGPLEIENELSFGPWKFSKVSNGSVLAISHGSAGRWLSFDYDSGAIYPMSLDLSLGGSTTKWTNVFTKKLNNGADIAVPTTGGTMALKEDINTIGGDGTAGQVLTKTENGMAWQDAAGGSSLPDQTGNAGKFLTTDGTTASWGGDNLVQDNANFKGNGLAVGARSVALASGSTAYGTNSQAKGQNAVAIGAYSETSGQGVAIGGNAKSTALRAIQLGGGTNSDANTFKVSNTNGNFEMMDANGNVPLERLTYVTNQIGDISTALTAILGE